MKEIKNVLICGLGAIGSVYAVRVLQSKKFNLKILVDKNRLEFYQNSPIIFNQKTYDFDYITFQEEGFFADLVLIATKNNGLQKALLALKKFIKKDTIILSLLNGIKSEELIRESFNGSIVPDSYYIGHTSMRNGRDITHDGVFKTVFGEKNNDTHSDAVVNLKNFFDECSIPFDIPIDIEYSIWWKFILNVGYNQASTVLNAPYAVFQSSETAKAFAINLMEEALLLAKAKGVRNTEKMIPEILEVIEKMRPEARTSMLQDVDAKRETEVDIFSGYICEEALKYGIDVPYNRVVYEIIKSIDEKHKLLIKS